MRGFKRGTGSVSMGLSLAENFYYPRGSVSSGSWLAGLFQPLLLWQRRWRQRQDLAALDPRLLRDIGVTPREVFRETNKPFWRA